MRYLLQTVRDEKDQLQFKKERVADKDFYFAESIEGQVERVDMTWVLEHQKDILNVEFSNGSIFPLSHILIEKKPMKSVTEDGLINHIPLRELLEEQK